MLLRTEVAEQHRQEDEAVSHPQQRYDQVQPEEEDLDELGLGERQHDDTRQVGHGHTGQHLTGRTHEGHLSSAAWTTTHTHTHTHTHAGLL